MNAWLVLFLECFLSGVTVEHIHCFLYTDFLIIRAGLG